MGPRRQGISIFAYTQTFQFDPFTIVLLDLSSSFVLLCIDVQKRIYETNNENVMRHLYILLHFSSIQY